MRKHHDNVEWSLKLRSSKTYEIKWYALSLGMHSTDHTQTWHLVILDNLRAPRKSTEALHTWVYAHLWCQANDFPPSFHAQIRAYYATNARAQHLPLVVEQHSGIVIESHEATVWSSYRLFCAYNDCTTDVSPANLDSSRSRGCGKWPGAFYNADDFISNRTPAIVDLLLEYIDTLNQECTWVVYDL